MEQDFDPYYRWLGIPPEQQPPNHYRLLGLNLFEVDPEVIETAAHRQIGHLRTYQTGKYSQLSQKLLNEVAAAKICLLSPSKKAAYDQALRGKLRPQTAPVAAPPSQTPVPTYYDRLLVEAHAKLSQSEVRRLELQEGRRTKVAVLIASVVVAVLLVLPVSALMIWSVMSNSPRAGEAVPRSDPRGPDRFAAQSAAEIQPDTTQHASPASRNPLQRRDLLVLPDSLTDRPPPAGGDHAQDSSRVGGRSDLIVVPDSLIEKSR
jgi:hypothetical protein